MSQRRLTSWNGGRYVAMTCLIILISDNIQDKGHLYPTLRRIAIDFLACQASSIPCECLFSGGGEVATKRRAQLGAMRFEELQVLKFAWRNNIADLASWSTAEVEEVDDTRVYEDLFNADQEQSAWDVTPDEIASWSWNTYKYYYREKPVQTGLWTATRPIC